MTERAVPQKLTMVAAHKLVSLMLDETMGFTAMKMSFSQYATFASEKLHFQVTKQQVATRVAEFQIPAGEPMADADLSALASTVLAHGQALADLQERIAKLEGWVNTTFPTKGLLKAV